MTTALPITWTRRSRQGMKQAQVDGHVYTAWLVSSTEWLLDRDGFEIGQGLTWRQVEAQVREEAGRG